MNATISGDIIASTSLNETELRLVISEITDLFNILSEKYNQADEFFWGRLIKGDYVECYIREPKLSLRVALLLKTAVKKTVLQSNKNTAQKKKRDLFQK